MVALFEVEAVFDDKFLKLGHFLVYFLREGAVEHLNVVDEAEELVFHLVDVVSSVLHSLDLLDNILVLFDRQHYYNNIQAATYCLPSRIY